VRPVILISVRILGALLTSLFWWWLGRRWGMFENPFTLAAWVASLGILWFPFLGWPALQWLGRQDRAGANRRLQAIEHRFPGTKHAAGAAARRARLV